MRQYIFAGIITALALFGCNRETKQAQAQLNEARILMERLEFATAKARIDSLRANYPKEYGVLREGLTLMRLIEQKEAERNIAFIDSLLPIRQKEAEAAAKDFTFEKDSLYEDVGNYIWKQQTVERNLERCYIRSGVNEKGEPYLASVYYGASPLNHTGIRLTQGDSFVETPSIPYDGGVNYRFANLGFTTEVVTYKGDNGIDAIKFIHANKDKRVRADYTGGKPYTAYIADGDKKAIAATYEFAAILSDINRMATEKEKAYKKLDYLKGKLNE